MAYVVHHVDGDGQPRLEDRDDLDGALARVEELRNDGQASEVRVLREVPIEIRTYYRAVAVDDGAPAAPAAAPSSPTVPDLGEPPSGAVVMGPPPAAAPAPDAGQVDDPAEDGRVDGRRPLFGRS